MSKQDRQGVRTAADLERKYEFGDIGKQSGKLDRYGNQVSQLNQALSQFMVETNAAIKSLQEKMTGIEVAGRQELQYAKFEESEGTYILSNGATYETLLSSWDASVHITLYRHLSDGSTRYYHCMGTCIKDGVNGLIFQYGYGSEAESVFIGEDGTMTVTTVTN